MTFEKRIGRFFGLNDEEWLRHANPISIWTRFIILPFLVISIWSRLWIGWYALIPISIILLWMYINPRFFEKPKTTDSWSAKSVLGERIWANRGQIKVPEHHKTIVTILTLLQIVGGVFLVVGLYQLHFWATLCGMILIYMAKMWFLDRMVWVFEDMKKHPEYKSLLY
jgi:hypothetical protein